MQKNTKEINPKNNAKFNVVVGKKNSVKNSTDITSVNYINNAIQAINSLRENHEFQNLGIASHAEIQSIQESINQIKNSNTHYKNNDIIELIWMLSKVRYYEKDLLLMYKDSILQRMNSIKAIPFVKLLQAMATLTLFDEQILSSCLDRIDSIDLDITGQSNAAHYLSFILINSVKDNGHNELEERMRSSIKRIVEPILEGQIDDNNIIMIRQIFNIYSAGIIKLKSGSLRRSWRTILKDNKGIHSSKVQKSVCINIENAYEGAKVNHEYYDNLICAYRDIEFSIEKRGIKFHIEVDGVHHYFINNHMRNGSTLFRNNIYRIVHDEDLVIIPVTTENAEIISEESTLAARILGQINRKIHEIEQKNNEETTVESVQLSDYPEANAQSNSKQTKNSNKKKLNNEETTVESVQLSDYPEANAQSNSKQTKNSNKKKLNNEETTVESVQLSDYPEANAQSNSKQTKNSNKKKLKNEETTVESVQLSDYPEANAQSNSKQTKNSNKKKLNNEETTVESVQLSDYPEANAQSNSKQTKNSNKKKLKNEELKNEELKNEELKNEELKNEELKNKESSESFIATSEEESWQIKGLNILDSALNYAANQVQSLLNYGANQVQSLLNYPVISTDISQIINLSTSAIKNINHLVEQELMSNEKSIDIKESILDLDINSISKLKKPDHECHSNYNSL